MARYSAFLSYARENSDIARKFRDALGNEGHDAWLDKSEIKGGDEWEQVIRRGQTMSDCLVVLVTKDILNSYVPTEIQLAEELRKPIIPLVFDDAIDSPDEIIQRLKRNHYIDFRNRYKKGMAEAVEAVKRVHTAPVIATYNVKGGVGKTTVTIQLATYFFKKCKKRVLVIDFDPQTNLSTSLVLPKVEKSGGGIFGGGRRASVVDILQPLQDQRKSVVGVLEHAANMADDSNQDFDLDRYIYTIDREENNATLDIVVGDKDLKALATNVTPNKATKISNGFARFVGQCRKNYDVVFVDMNPSVSAISQCALKSTTHILSPIRPDSYSMQGLNLLDDISHENNDNARGCEQLILINDPREDRNSKVRALIAASKFADKLLAPELVYSRYFLANPEQKVNPSLTSLPAYGNWGESLRPDCRSLKEVAETVAMKVKLHL